jgi:hypothetical protein
MRMNANNKGMELIQLFSINIQQSLFYFFGLSLFLIIID